MHKGPNFSTLLPTLVVSACSRQWPPYWVWAVTHRGFDLPSVDCNDAKDLSLGLLAICISSVRKSLFKCFACFFTRSLGYRGALFVQSHLSSRQPPPATHSGGSGVRLLTGTNASLGMTAAAHTCWFPQCVARLRTWISLNGSGTALANMLQETEGCRPQSQKLRKVFTFLNG